MKDHPTIVQSSKRGLMRVFGRTSLILLLLAFHFYLLFAFLMPLMEKLPALFGGVVIFTAVMLIYVLNTRENPSIKLSWCIVIAVLPVFGSLLYFIVRYDLGHRLSSKLHRQIMLESAEYISQPADTSGEPELDNLARYLYHWGGNPAYQNTRVQYFPLGEDKFQEMLVQLEKAEKFIFMEYFTIAPSYMWSRVLEILARKARDGVEVRVMYDGSCAVADLPYDYPRKLAELGIQCKVFSPFRPLVSTHYNNRDHRKILVIDGHTAFTGGVNLSDRYINRHTVYGHWKDTAIMVKGDAARSFTLMFLQMWNATEKERCFEPYLLPSQPDPGAEGYVIPYADTPTDQENLGEMVYLNILNQAKDYVYITTPYLILDNEMVTALSFAAKRGVDVRVILPHIPDKKYAFVLAQSHYRELTEAGVKIYEYTPGFMHAKMFLSDDIHAVVGTINLDYRSLYLHYECAAYLYKVPAIRDIYTDFQAAMEKSQLITMDDIKKMKPAAKIVGRLLKIIAPLM